MGSGWVDMCINDCAAGGGFVRWGCDTRDSELTRTTTAADFGLPLYTTGTQDPEGKWQLRKCTLCETDIPRDERVECYRTGCNEAGNCFHLNCIRKHTMVTHFGKKGDNNTKTYAEWDIHEISEEGIRETDFQTKNNNVYTNCVGIEAARAGLRMDSEIIRISKLPRKEEDLQRGLSTMFLDPQVNRPAMGDNWIVLSRNAGYEETDIARESTPSCPSG